MEKFIFTKKNFMAEELCEDIIKDIDIKNNKLSYENKNKNNFENYLINDEKVIKFINNELIYELQTYYYKLLDNDKCYTFILDKIIHLNKVKKNVDYKKLSHDFRLKENKIYSYFTFIIFLNNNNKNSGIKINNTHIKPEIGKLLVFPCGWCFPYGYLKCSESDNYFITGTIYNKY